MRWLPFATFHFTSSFHNVDHRGLLVRRAENCFAVVSMTTCWSSATALVCTLGVGHVYHEVLLVRHTVTCNSIGHAPNLM
jgi:hypothetical protein